MSHQLLPPQNVQTLASKLYDVDPDIRFMSLNDLQAIFNNNQTSAFLAQDYNACSKTVEGFLHTLNDTNGEVQNLTIKCLGPFVNRIHPGMLCPLLHKIGNLEIEDAVDKSVPALAIRTIVVSLPRPTTGATRPKAVVQAYEAISKVVIPHLVGVAVIPYSDVKNLPPPAKGLLEEDLASGSDSNAIDVLTELARCFGPMLQAEEIAVLENITLRLLESDRVGSGMKKKAAVAFSALANYFSDSLLSSIISHIIQVLRNPHLTPANRKMNFTILGALAKSIPTKFAPHLKVVVPFVSAALSQEELDEPMTEADEDGYDPQVDEVRENALNALESFLSSGAPEMQRYYDECTDASLRFLKYDPNYADNEESSSEHEDSDDDFEVDEDFEEEEGADDEDDLSWKVRRCAARTLNSIVSIRGHSLLENASVYNKIAESLISRFQEREETVRLEVLSTLAHLIRKTGEEEARLGIDLVKGVEFSLPTHPPSRKRRRGYSDISMSEPMKSGRFTGSTSPDVPPQAPSGPRANLATISADISRGLVKLLKSTSTLTKQSSMSVLKDLIITRQGGADEFLSGILEPVVDTIKASDGANAGTSASSATGVTMQSQALQLISEITKMHSSTTLQPHFARIIAAVLHAAQDKSPKVACEALTTLQQVIKALTPPRTASSNSSNAGLLEEILGVTMSLASSKNVDVTVRQESIAVLGTLLGRVMDPKSVKVLSKARLHESFAMLYETIKNETTRYASVKAVETIACRAPSGTEFDKDWFSQVCLELGAQFRKADRSLRSASLSALRALITLHQSNRNLDAQSTQQVIDLLLPLLTSDDPHLLVPSLNIITSMVRDGSISKLSDTFESQVASLVTSPTAASLSDPLCNLMQAIGEKSLGRNLMKVFLQQVATAGAPATVGKVIGNLLVYGGTDVGVTTDDFLKELKSTGDDRRKSLALSILGEVGLRSGSSSQLSADFFISYLETQSGEVPLVAAISLGRAAAGQGNLQSWVPAILARIKQDTGQHYLVLHAIRELLQYNENDNDIKPFAGSLWDASLSASRFEETRTIGAECIANLTLIDPGKFLPVLQSLLSDQRNEVRGIAIQAFRDVFTVADATYDKELRPIIVETLTTMMRDSHVENRRSSLNSFNAAVRHKASLILPHMTTLLPLVMDQTFKDPSLTREVSMGPFKHTVDDGLEVRKNAYETLYSLLEIAPQRLDSVKVYDRVIAGINDDRGIQTLCNLMLAKLAKFAPEETARRLDDIAAAFTIIIAFTPKENSVRQEFEKADEAKKAVMKVSLDLSRDFSSEAATKTKWSTYLDEMKKVKDGALLKELEKEAREREGTSTPIPGGR